MWQEECKYILSEYNLIDIQKYMKDYKFNGVYIDGKYDFKDEKLSNTDIFRNKDIKYIKEKYPEVYDKMRNLGIIMHSNTDMAEKFMDFISYNRSTTESDKLYWEFNPSPKREILEVYVIPTGVFGFNKQHRTNGAGVFNDNYIKVSIIAGAQIKDVIDTSYKNTFDEFNSIKQEVNNKKMLKEKIKEDSEKMINMLNLIMFALSLIITASMILTGFSYTRIPKGIISDEFLNNHICRHCDKSSFRESPPFPGSGSEY